ncbi:MAG: leucine-rich repeat protein [Ruminococcus sp.]|nr:leucine-rich repeat protein [Ruminococcus sp.]
MLIYSTILLRQATLIYAAITAPTRTSLSPSGLKEIELPQGVAVVEKEAFEGCDKLEKVTLGKKVTEIGNYAFALCPELKEIFIPASVTKIGYYAFSGDDNFVIHCYRNSAAHKYAVNNEIKFKLLDGTSPEIKKGDFDGDSCYDVNELVVMQKMVSGWKVGDVSDDQADLNGDGSVDVADLVLMQKRVAGRKVKFSDEEEDEN